METNPALLGMHNRTATLWHFPRTLATHPHHIESVEVLSPKLCFRTFPNSIGHYDAINLIELALIEFKLIIITISEPE